MTRPDRRYPDLAPGEPHRLGTDAAAAVREAWEEPVPYSLTPAAEVARWFLAMVATNGKTVADLDPDRPVPYTLTPLAEADLSALSRSTRRC